MANVTPRRLEGCKSPDEALEPHGVFKSVGEISLNASTRSLGITPPLSMEEPATLDLKLSKSLEEVLERHGVYESEAEINHSNSVLAKVKEMVDHWIKEAAIAKNVSASVVEKVGGKVFTFGSHRLGIRGQGDDIDVLCVAPRHVERKDFFDTFYTKLKTCDDVKNLLPIEQAFVPVMRMTFDGIKLVMVFARLADEILPDDVILTDNTILKNLDSKCVRSLNGRRVVDEILLLIPDEASFKIALRVIKLWAKKKGVYSNALGFLGGASWTILVARVCQLYPRATPSNLILKFFFIWSSWEWPKPVLLKPHEVSDLGFPVWDVRINPTNRYELMPILTPKYPQLNSAYNVSTSNLNEMKMQFKESFHITEQIFAGNCSWDKLFEPSNFFARYNHYVMLVVIAETEANFTKWQALLKSRVRVLVGGIEGRGFMAHVNTESFGSFNKRKHEYTCRWFIGLLRLQCDGGAHRTSGSDLTTVIQTFCDRIYSFAQRALILTCDMTMDIRHVQREHLSAYLSPELVEKV